MIGKSLKDREFGYWKVLSDDGPYDKHSREVLCRCSLCGKERKVNVTNLLRGMSRSCGCAPQKYLGAGEGVRVRRLNAKPYKRSKTGYAGVYEYKGRYKAQIGLRGESIYIGMFDTIGEAVDARREKERELFDPLRKKYGLSPIEHEEG